MTQENTVEQTIETPINPEESAAKTTDGAVDGTGEGTVSEAETEPTAAAESATQAAATTDAEQTPLNAADATVTEAETEPTAAEIIADLEAKLVLAEQKNAELVDNLQRTAAEFQNSRRRQEKQVADAIERAGGHAVERLLPVMDDLTLAFGNLPEELDEATNAWLGGFRQIQKKLETILTDQGVSAIPLEGEFDPNRHEAVSSEPSETVESGHIIQTLRVGYEYKGRVLRPALVRVAM